MQRLVLITAILFTPLRPIAQTLNPADYIYPIRNVAGYYSANFGEMRPNHFHSGVDIKTDGAEGRPLVAVADGYISRIAVSASGYGRAIYVTLNNGTTAVYGHISRYRDDIEKYVQGERLRRQKNDVDLYPPHGLFAVSQGDVIAFSGNSGTSFGPHLHFELRDTPTQKALNIIRQGVISPKDDIPPYIVRLHYIEVDTLDGIPIHTAPRSYPVAKVDKNTYRLEHKKSIHVGRNGYFVLEATDRRNDVQNTFGLYRISLQVDSAVVYEYRMDGFTFNLSRYCNTASYYPMQLTSRNEAICLAMPEGGSEYFCTTLHERGAIRTVPGQMRRVHIETEDDCGNTSHIDFTVQGSTESFRAQTDSTLTTVYRDRPNTLRIGTEFTARIPAGTLYESIRCRPEICSVKLLADTTLAILSPVYRLLDASIPLNTAMTVSIRAFIPQDLHAHVTLATRTRTGRLSYVGGSYANTGVMAHTRTTGDLFIVADTTAPAISPLFTNGADMTSQKELRFRVSDNFSGIASCTLLIDGEWTPCDRYPVKGALHAPIITPPSGRSHSVRLIVCDNCGNTTHWEGNFRH